PTAFGSSQRWMTRTSVNRFGCHFDRSSPGYMLNQIAYARTLALGYFASNSFCTHRVPATQTGHVGDSNNTSRTLPTSLLNIVRSSSTPFRSDSFGAAVPTGANPPVDGKYPLNRNSVPRAAATTRMFFITTTCLV